MAILQKLKSLLGFDGSDSERGGAREVGVTVEREGSTDEGNGSPAGADRDEPTEGRAAEPPQSAASGSSAAGSTESLTEPTDAPEEGAEPAEATGPETGDAAPTAEKTPDLSQGEEPEPDAAGVGDVDVAEAEPTAETDTEAAEAEAGTEPTEPEDEPDADAEDVGAADGPVEGEADADEADTEPEPEPANQEPVDSIKGIGPAYADRLAGAGVETVGELAVADAAELADQTDISETRIQGWIDRAEVR
ncbi:helix-hairpin-helix domain-containing protein [Natrinema sp. 74]|uniref:helix-hairpin-helix domain-containing protein n=1 Tax=Natrinema sp. 74 TaxID=3384159 RepID=UPI0038D46658